MIKYLKYILIIAATLLLLIFLIRKIYFRQEIRQYNGTQSLSGLKDTVEVFTDSYVVPHIFAKNNEDLFLTTGYIIAREHLFQLSLLASVMRGEISTLLGDEYIEHDNYIKQNELFSIYNEINFNIDEENIKLIESYCLGINTWVNETSRALPRSFKKLKTNPPEWESSDVVNVLSIMTKNIVMQRRKTYLQKVIKQYFGELRYSELFENGDEVFLFSDSVSMDDLKLENEISALIGISGLIMDSDVMIIPADRTSSKKPILIFNDGSDIQQSSNWYDMQLKSSDYNIEGSVIPGFPLPLVGKTDAAAWAFSGEISQVYINQIFDLAKGRTDIQQISNEDNFINYADTTGYYFNSKTHSRRFDLSEEELYKKEEIQIDDIISVFIEPKNSRNSEIAHLILNIYNGISPASDNSIQILMDWNGDESNNSAELLLFNSIYTRLLENIFKDEISLIGEDTYSIFTSIPDFVEKSVINVLFNKETSWSDDISTTNYRETLSDIVIKSVDAALTELISEYGSNTSNWRLEKANTSTIKQLSGTAVRKIYDLSDMNRSYSNLPIKQLAQQKNIKYSEQSRISDNFRIIESNEDAIRNSNKYQKLILCPIE